MRKLTDEEKRLLKTVVEHFDKEDKAVRERQIRTWRRLKYFWDGFQKIWYSETAHDWRIWDSERTNDATDQAYYDKPVNIFRAYLESIIAALSVVVPPVTCYPDDADNYLDLMTAKAGNQIAKLIYRHNNVPLLWIHALFIFCTEGMVACYNYPKEDEKYGTYKEKKIKDEDETHQMSTCPNCGQTLEDVALSESDEFQPESDEQEDCPNCGSLVTPDKSQVILTVERIVGITNKAKSRQCMEAYGGLYVKIPNYAKKQEDIPYLMFSYETHYSFARDRYPDIRDKIGPNAGNAYEAYERWGRMSSQYQGEYPINNVTVRSTWLRPVAFEVLTEDECKKFKKLFPQGAKVVLVNDEFAEAEGEALDDRWTLTCNPLSDFIHHDPLGLLLTSLQEITNDLVSLVLQTIEHGIPQTIADPTVLNFNAYSQTEVAPGSIIPGTPKSGKSMGDSFYEVRTATLSGEVLPFSQQVQDLAQLVSGALPSLFGGAMQDNKTASAYSMSRAQALQRQQNTWKIFIYWWKEIFGKVIPSQIKEIHEDEKHVEKDEFGNFINTFIHKAELEGKIGRIELEANENLPMSWNQMRDIIMQLLQANSNPQIQEILSIPENLPILREALGLSELYIAGEDDRDKQQDEIKQLLTSEPIMVPPDEMMVGEAMANGMPPPQEQPEPSVEVDPIFDNHKIEFEICRKWIVSPEGRMAKTDNEAGYQNVLLHAKMHYQYLQQQAMTAAQGVQQPQPTEQDKEAPIMSEGDVNVQ